MLLLLLLLELLLELVVFHHLGEEAVLVALGRGQRGGVLELEGWRFVGEVRGVVVVMVVVQLVELGGLLVNELLLHLLLMTEASIVFLVNPALTLRLR